MAYSAKHEGHQAEATAQAPQQSTIDSGMNPLVAIALLTAMPADTGYRCVDAQGRIAFQDSPCPRGNEESRFRYPARDVAPPVESGQTRPPPANSGGAPPVAPDAEPRAAPPEQYLCERFDGGERYYSDTGETAPYFVPMGVMGWPPRSVGEAYGSRGRLGISAPEISRPAVAPPEPGMLAGGYTKVEDRCYRLSSDAACAALREQLDVNLHEQRRSFRESRAPLQARERTLRAMLAGC